MILGLDLGIDQGVLTASDWQKIRVQQGRRFAIHRCEEALSGVDSTFAKNAAGAKAVGLARSPYFPWHPDLDPVSQAIAHYDAARGVGTEPGDLPPSLDVELARGLDAAHVQASLAPYMDKMALLFKRPSIFYSYPWFLQAMLAGPGVDFLASSWLWLAAYQDAQPAPPAPWSRVHFWQRSGGKSYRTPEGAPCDEDVFLGSDEEFAALCDPDAVVVVPASAENGA